MSRPLVALLAGLVLVPATGGVQALSLVEAQRGEDDTQLFVRTDRSNLEVRAVEGNLTLDGEPLDPQPTRVQTPGGSWRGFENVTAFQARGNGSLLIAANGTGLLVAIDTPSGPSNRSGVNEAAARTSADEPGNASSAPESRTASEASAPSPAAGDASSPGSASPGPGEHHPRSAGSDTDAGEGEPGLGLPDPVPVLLGLLAGGAFLVERWTRDGAEEER